MVADLRPGRNQPCWCGSGRKYKKCHLDRSSQPKANPFIAERTLVKNFSKKFCLHPLQNSGQCVGNIVQAHTVQQSGGLSRIAQNNHVYGVKPSMAQLFNNTGQFEPTLLGVNRASTFTGFCAFHDDTTFAPIEKKPFHATDEQCFLIAYRGLCRELFTKRAAFESVELHRDMDKGRDLSTQFQIQSWINSWKSGMQNSLRRLEHEKTSYDEVLMTKGYSVMKRVVIQIEKTPEILCSGAFTPQYDFRGQMLQDLSRLNIPLDDITCCIIPTDSGGAVIFTWQQEVQGANTRLLRSLFALPKERIGSAIVTMLFEHLENIFWSPIWWDGLKTETTNFLAKKLMSGTINGRNPTCLQLDNDKIVDWQITAIDNNAFTAEYCRKPPATGALAAQKFQSLCPLVVDMITYE